MPTFDTVIFDFDLTLADSTRGAVECINYALRNLGLSEAPAEAICRTIGLSLSDTLVRLAGTEHADKSDEFARHFVRRADETMADLTRLYEVVPSVVRQLKESGFTLGIVSTKFRRRIATVLGREGLLDAFDLIVGGEDVARHKPDPEGLLLAINRLNTSADRALYVGDSLVDAETAKQAGVRCLIVLSGHRHKEEFGPYPVEGILQSLNDLPRWLSHRQRPG